VDASMLSCLRSASLNVAVAIHASAISDVPHPVLGYKWLKS
jgi:hypothetical protein